MNELETKIAIIELLIQADHNEHVLFLRTLKQETGADEKIIKKIIKELKNINMVESDFAVDDHGMLAGRGYVLTTRATQWSIREWLTELKKIQAEDMPQNEDSAKNI